MGLMERVATLLRANVNDLIDRAEDPEKMLKQLLAEWKSIDTSLTGILKERRRGPSRTVLAGG